MLLFPQKYVSELTEFKHSVPRNQVPESFFPPSNMAATAHGRFGWLGPWRSLLLHLKAAMGPKN